MKDLQEAGESTDFFRVIQRFVDPLFKLCTRMSLDIVQKKPRSKSIEDAEWDTQVFLINCLGYVQSILESFEFAASSIVKIDQELQSRLQALVESLYRKLSIDSGLSKGEDSKQIASALDSFEAYLSSPTLLASPRLSLLNFPARRSAVQQKALVLLANDYDAMVKKEDRNKAAISSRRSPQELRLLLGINATSV